MVLAEYFCEFSSTANYLVSKHCMTKREASMSTFPKEFRANITTRLTVKCPDVCPDDGYNLKDMDSTAQFVISLLGLRPNHNPSLTEERKTRDGTIKVVITT